MLDDPDSDAGLLSVREAAKEARILDEMLALPDGIDTVHGFDAFQGLPEAQQHAGSGSCAAVSDG